MAKKHPFFSVFLPFFDPFSSRIAVKLHFLKKLDFTAILDENGSKKAKKSPFFGSFLAIFGPFSSRIAVKLIFHYFFEKILEIYCYSR